MTGNRPEIITPYDLRAPGWLGRRPLIGILLVLTGSLVFGLLAFNVQTNGPLMQWDVPLAKEFHTEAVNLPTRTIELILFGFYVGKEIIQVIAIFLTLYFLYKHFWRELLMLWIGLGGGALLWYFLSRFFDRPRPEAQIGIAVSDPSFPSGHVITSILCYGLLAYLLIPKMPSRFWKWFIAGVALLFVVYVGFSRLFLGGHYLTDIIGGGALGIAWAGLAYTSIEEIFK